MKQYNNINEMARNRVITLRYVNAMVNAILSIFLRASKCLSPQLYYIWNVLTENVIYTIIYTTWVYYCQKRSHSFSGYSFAIGWFVISPSAVRNSTAHRERDDILVSRSNVPTTIFAWNGPELSFSARMISLLHLR